MRARVDMLAVAASLGLALAGLTAAADAKKLIPPPPHAAAKPEPAPTAAATKADQDPAQHNPDASDPAGDAAGAAPEEKSDSKAAAKPPAWTPSEIADAQARCNVIMKRFKAVAIPQSPMREGECGAPAPIQLVSVGAKPEVAISPPALVTCELAEALNTWLEHGLQPLARKEFGSEIIKIENMSDYSCRNAYGRAKNKLSEHGHANALDIRGFVTATAKPVYVLEGWGKPQREILAEIAAAKAAAAKADALKAQALQAEQANQKTAKGNAAPETPPVVTGSNAGAPAAGIARSTIIDGTPKLTVTLPGARPAPPAPAPAFSIAPDKLGGPEDETAANANNVTRFLHAAHDAACQIFGTTLGPEANEAHRNHFHVDMAERKVTKICD